MAKVKTEDGVFKHILMPTDGSEHSEKAIERGMKLAKLCGAKVTGIHVAPLRRSFSATDGWIDTVLEHRLTPALCQEAPALAVVQRFADAVGVPCEVLLAVNNRPIDAIVDAAKTRGCDLIVMTARCRTGLASLIMGSEGTRLLHRSSIAILMFHPKMRADHRDGRPSSTASSTLTPRVADPA